MAGHVSQGRHPRFQCSSASRKFLNGMGGRVFWALGISFSALQRAENSSTRRARMVWAVVFSVSVLFSEPKIPQRSAGTTQCTSQWIVSVLFSEPKIPQRRVGRVSRWWRRGFSALQRAENSSTHSEQFVLRDVRQFQCSSASRKFLNIIQPAQAGGDRESFSALQRAENSSTVGTALRRRPGACFSALQRAENSSTVGAGGTQRRNRRFSALQRAENSSTVARAPTAVPARTGFSALQRAENSSTGADCSALPAVLPFQCSSASRKFLNARTPECAICYPPSFQCSSASRKFLNPSPFASSAVRF